MNLPFDRDRIADFCRRWNVVELAIFGSVARGDFREDSDIDVMVTFAPEAHIGLLSLARMENELSASVQPQSRPRYQRRSETAHT